MAFISIITNWRFTSDGSGDVFTSFFRKRSAESGLFVNFNGMTFVPKEKKDIAGSN